MGERLDSDRHQIASADSPKRFALEDQDRSLFPSHGKHRLPLDDRTVFFAHARDDREVQPGLVPDALSRSASVAGFNGFGFDFLFDFAKGTLSGLESPSPIPAFPHVGRNWTVGQ